MQICLLLNGTAWAGDFIWLVAAGQLVVCCALLDDSKVHASHVHSAVLLLLQLQLLLHCLASQQVNLANLFARCWISSAPHG
jgi:hypothetical protein